MKIKRIMILMVLLTVIINTTGMIYAQESDTRSSLYISAYNGAVDKSSSGVDIKYTMLARCDKMNVSIEFQVYENDNWVSIETWSIDSSSSPFSGMVTYKGKIDIECRAKIAYRAYVSNIMVEQRSLTIYP